MRFAKFRWLAGLLAALHGGAEAQSMPSFSFGGYGTAGVVHSDNDQGDYVVDAFKPTGPGRTRNWSPEVDSRLGLQATATFNPSLSAVVQVLFQQRYDDSWRPVVEWANLKYQATPDFSVRAGRVVLPIYMVTDSRRVGYANPWVRPPVEVYSMVPVTSTDGIDASYRMSVGSGTNTVQFTAGTSDSKFPNSLGLGAGIAQVRHILALVDTFEVGFLTARLNYGQADLTIPEFAPLFGGFRQFGPIGAAIADRYDLDGRRVNFVGFGANYDPGPWFAIAEWAHFDTHSVVGEKTAWYVSGGPRIGKFTPYATYARLKGDSNTSDPGLPLAFLPPAAVPTAALLNATLNAALGAIAAQSTVSVGVRWDFMKNAALKLQYDRVKLDSGSRGTFGNLLPSFPLGGTVQLFSAAVDFVF
jgi:hypothetical protein